MTGREAHGALVIVLLFLGGAVPELRPWPWYLLAPLLAYFAVVGLVAPLRRTRPRFAVGRADRFSVAATLAVIIISCSVLVLFQTLMTPDLTGHAGRLPLTGFGNPLLVGAVFAVVNAVLEEVIFRGILYDAVEGQWGWRVAVVATAVVFGFGHRDGYPPGRLGAVLAGMYGLMLGGLRHRTGGLTLPTLAHVAADATIYGIVARWADSTG
jgi:membrane protease YdiL (CAAX protease family)